VVTLSLISVDGLTKHYGRVKALEKASFTVGTGVTGLIGPNGAGKSTLIKIALGLVRPTYGEARVFGLDSRKERSKIMERVGVLHEKPRFPYWVTGREYLEYSAKLKRISDVTGEIKGISEICGLTDFVDRKIGAFSAGMVQRLGLADALIGKPELVILDEPTANLDPLGRHDVLDKIKRLRDEDGMNFLISTHILSELEKVCDNVVILNEGTVLTYGSFDDLLSKYSRRKIMMKVDDPNKFIECLNRRTREKAVVEGDSIVVEVDNATHFIKELNALFRSKAFTLKELRSCSATLEDIFIEALRRKQFD